MSEPRACKGSRVRDHLLRALGDALRVLAAQGGGRGRFLDKAVVSLVNFGA